MTNTTTVVADEENSAEIWWDAFRARLDETRGKPYATLARKLAGHGDWEVTADSAVADAFVAWASTLPGWNDGPAHAPHPLVVRVDDEVPADAAEGVTGESISFEQIRALRGEAKTAQDWDQVAICDLALEGEIDPDDYTVISDGAQRRLRTMTREAAYAACAAAINAARAQADA